ncbi:PKD domain-containing protein [bacterium]|nr:PKD domain-containing protein [bacterium]
MNRTSILIYALILLIAASMSGCGGQGANLPQAPSTSTSDVLAPPINSTTGGSMSDRDLLAMIERGESPFTFAQQAQQKMEQQLEQSNDALPGNLSGMALMPYGEAELSGNGQKITSALQDLDPTIVYADSGDITVNVSSITISPGPGDLSWAMYQLNLPDGGYPLSLRLGIDTISGVGGPGQGFYVLVSNYTTKRWWMSDLFTTNGFKTIDLPTKVDLVPQNYLSPMNNLYVAILVYDGVTIEMNGLQQDTNTAPQALISETSNTYVRRTTEEFQFRSESEDGDNGIAGFSWDFNDDMVEDDNVIVVNHTYDTPGLHKVRLTVFDENGGSDTDTLYVWTYDTDDSVLPDEFMEALNEADPDPVPPPDIPLPELGFDETFEYLTSDFSQEWWEIPDTQDNVQWKNFNDNDGVNEYLDMHCWLPEYGSYYYDDHTAMLPYADSLANTVGNWQDMQGVVQTGAWQHGIGVVNEGITLDVEDNDPLATAIKRLMNEYPDPLHDATFEQIQTEVAGVPDDFQRALARLVNAIRQAKPYHEAYMDPLKTTIFGDIDGLTTPPEGWPQVIFNDSLGMVVPHDDGAPIVGFLPNALIPQNFDYDDLFQGASVLTNAMDEFHAFLDGWTPGASFDFQVRTSLGDIRVTGDGDDVINLPDWDGGTENGFYLLQVDIGGNDDYHCHAGGNAALANPIAICIDYAGNDEYFRLDDPDDVDRTVVSSNDDTHQQGSGRMGYGLLLDLAGNDSYDAVRLSQGCSNFGVGILCDVGGDDSYGVEAMGQGASLVGIGALLDLDGMDNYYCWSRAQGFSSFRGVGILSDRGGDNDTYTAESVGDPAKPEYGDGIGGVINYAQGCARGKFPSGDTTADPFIGSAGLGLLCEDGGVDTYTAAVFSQACSFYEGTGILLELGGDDNYSGDRFCGSIAILRAAAMLWDRSGNDQYIYTGIGGLALARDYAVTWLLDDSGNDIYESDSGCMGVGQINGFSYMVDYAGSDSYTVLSTPVRFSLGSAFIDDTDPGNNDVTPTLGLFVDIGPGADTYSLPEPMLDRDGNVLTVADDNIWVRAKHTVLEPGWHNYEYGVGADGNWMMP